MRYVANSRLDPRIGLRCRRDRRFGEAAVAWADLLELASTPAARRRPVMRTLRQFAAEALAIHHEHRARDYGTARDLALFALEDADKTGKKDGVRHRLARLERKIARQTDAGLFTSI